MNNRQRIVLIIGSVALLVVLATAGTYQHAENGVILKSNANALYANLWDWHTALVRSGIVSVAMAAVYFAVGNWKK